MTVFRKLGVTLLLILAITVLVGPVTAFRAERLDIRVLPDGNGDVQFDYSLSWFEHVAVFLRVVDPAQQLEQELEAYSGTDVQVQSVTDSSATLRITGYASVTQSSGKTTYTTPELQFHDAKEIAKHYWWAHIVTVDFRPDITTVTFPDGYSETFAHAAKIPVIIRTVQT
jgi:hypothetical protein